VKCKENRTMNSIPTTMPTITGMAADLSVNSDLIPKAG
jgi:hypothetical protein